MSLRKSLHLFFLFLISQTFFLFAQIEDGGSRSDWIATNPVIECPTLESLGTTFCTQAFQPVCAYRNSDPPGTPGRTMANFCGACFYAGYDFYSPGACEEINNGEGPTIIIPSESETGEGEFGSEEEMNLAENEEGEVFWCEGQFTCDDGDSPVCAYQAGERGATVANSCEACGSGRGYDYYTKGPCYSGNEEEQEEDIQINIEGIPAAPSEDL